MPEDLAMLKKVRDHLHRICSEYEQGDLMDIREHELMPASAKAKEFLDEVVTNGVMRRTEGALEFMHESVRDYFAGVGLLDATTDSICAEVPAASWVRDEKIHRINNEHRSRLYDALVIYSGLKSESDSLVIGLADKDPLLAAVFGRRNNQSGGQGGV